MFTKHLCFTVMMLIAVAGIAFAQSHPLENHAGTVSRHSQSGSAAITAKETLRFTYSDSGSLGQTTSCSSTPCQASAPIYSYSLVCPVAAGKSCTYDIQIAGQVKSFSNSNPALAENGLYQFLVDGATPTGGGTDVNGYYAWQFEGPSFTFGTSYNVHSVVNNTVANQKHTVTVNIGCETTLDDASGCTAESGFQTLVVRIWTP